MILYYLDASAWVKRHVSEIGSDWMRSFWRQRLPLACSSLGSLEVLSAILRRSRPDDPRAETVATELSADCEGFYEVNLSAPVISRAQDLIRRHRLRSADAVHLASALLVAQELNQSVCVVASDAELLAAATAEGLATLDPQLDPPVPAIQT